jgi:hypothetical protein
MSKKWNPYKEEILRLYLVENMTLDQVMNRMLQTHGFDQKYARFIDFTSILIILTIV